MIDKNILIQRLRNIKNKKCYIKIFKLILDNNIEFSKNSNGIFFNTIDISDDIMCEIDGVVSYYESYNMRNR